VLVLTACSQSGDDTSSTTSSGSSEATTTTAPQATTTSAVPAIEVGVRHLDLVDSSRGRSLPTTVWYPANTAGEDARPGGGPYPVLLFSHGLRGLPADYEALITGWATGGYVVVAPAYPKTNRDAAEIDARDVTNQPTDASFVLDSVLALAMTTGDPFDGVLDPDRIAAAGHSEGAITTVGLFDGCCRDPRLKAGIVLAGDSIGFNDLFAGAATPILFVHGDADRLVPYRLGQATYARDPWPRAFLTLPGDGHIDPYLSPIAASFALVQHSTIGLLDGVLKGDAAALADLRATPGLDDQLG